MKWLYVTMIALLLAGCSHEAAYVDSEWGRSHQMAWDQEVANPDAPYKGVAPENIQGVSAEELMNAYNSSFSKAPPKAQIFTLGFTGFGD